MKDKQLKELLDQNARLIELGSALALAIERYGKYSKHGMSPNMRKAVKDWCSNLEENYSEFKPLGMK